jgi:DNA transformation protein
LKGVHQNGSASLTRRPQTLQLRLRRHPPPDFLIFAGPGRRSCGIFWIRTSRAVKSWHTRKPTLAELLKRCDDSSRMADDSFKVFILDQLSALPELRARAMFGAQGLYAGECFFGIVDAGRLFFKTDAQSQAGYTARGMGPFTYQMKGRVVTMGYHEVPPDVLENSAELTAWARRAVQVAASSKKPAKSPVR